ncbi:helix-turn-helix domain-containing protein [Wohlfahrtiimonas populi]|uniref:helix-turn-helix domain-containing protein n=1 Tax=Wohlfahrtiimonas populi TaxID=1940240 RepID=UPI00098D725E|nr:helix-turn-helix domain-containing protein [Wohlfahrtiimonas populi]
MVINFEGMTLKEIVEVIEKEAIRSQLLKTNWNKAQASADLDIDRKTMNKKIKEYGISR